MTRPLSCVAGAALVVALVFTLDFALAVEEAAAQEKFRSFPQKSFFTGQPRDDHDRRHEDEEEDQEQACSGLAAVSTRTHGALRRSCRGLWRFR